LAEWRRTGEIRYKSYKRKPIGIYRRTTRDTVWRRCYLRISSSTIRRSPRDLDGFPRDRRRVSSLVLEIYSRVNSTKRSKRTAYKELEILRNCKAPIGILPVYYI
jgi:hypothetical protein